MACTGSRPARPSAWSRSSAGKRDTVVTEYAWDMAWCDPCAADPLSARELRELGVFWINPDARLAPGAQDVPAEEGAVTPVGAHLEAHRLQGPQLVLEAADGRRHRRDERWRGGVEISIE